MGEGLITRGVEGIGYEYDMVVERSSSTTGRVCRVRAVCGCKYCHGRYQHMLVWTISVSDDAEEVVQFMPGSPCPVPHERRDNVQAADSGRGGRGWRVVMLDLDISCTQEAFVIQLRQQV